MPHYWIVYPLEWTGGGFIVGWPNSGGISNRTVLRSSVLPRPDRTAHSDVILVPTNQPPHHTTTHNTATIRSQLPSRSARIGWPRRPWLGVSMPFNSAKRICMVIVATLEYPLRTAIWTMLFCTITQNFHFIRCLHQNVIYWWNAGQSLLDHNNSHTFKWWRATFFRKAANMVACRQSRKWRESGAKETEPNTDNENERIQK